MSDLNQRVQEIFNEALELGSPEEQRAFVKGACGDDARLRQSVEALLQAHAAAVDFIPTRLPASPPTVEATESESPGTAIGRYKLLEKLGEGGFGAVYMAEQKEPFRRRVALKIIKLGMDTRQVVARFEAERQALALMDHPNIAKVLDAGTTDSGRPYFVMELVRGVKITEYCDQRKLSTCERLDLLVKVCQAVQHAHQKGVIHRDLKPSNILVTLHDGVPVPKVIDFGIAKATQQELTNKTVFTQFQQFIGTPAYMSPEQAELSGLDIDTRSDIYSLGVLLYELLTGKTPFDAQTLLAAGLDEMRRIIREEEPPRPSTRLSTMIAGELTTTAKHRHAEAPKLVSLIRGDLDWIVMKCLEKDRTRRYETANGLARDIQRHLSHDPVMARPPSTAYRVQKFVRRNKAAVLTAGAVAAALVLGAAISLWQALEARVAKRQALHHLYVADLNVVQQDYEQGNLGRVRRLLTETRDDPNGGFEWYYWQRRIHQDMQTFQGHSWVIRGVAISPDGKLVATASMDGTAKLWDPSTGRLLRTYGGWGDDCRSVSFSRDGAQLAIGGGQQFILWDIAQHRELLVITNKSLALVAAAALSSDGTQVALGGFFGPSSVWDVKTGKLIKELNDGPATDTCLKYSPDGGQLLAAGMEGVVRIWNPRTGELLHRLDPKAGWVWAVDFSPNGQRIVTAHWDGIVRVWRVADATLEYELNAHADVVYCACYSPQGNRIYSAGWDPQIRVWDALSGKPLPSLPKGHTAHITSLEISGDGQCIVTGTWNGEVKLWDPRQADEPRTFSARLWDEDRTVLARFWGSVRGPTAFLSGPDQGLIVAPNTNHNLSVWDFATHRELLVLKGHHERISAVAVSPDQQHIAAGSTKGTFIVWDAHDGRTILALRETTNKISAIHFSPDNRRVLFVGDKEVVHVCDAAGQLPVALTFGTNVGTAAFSPDGQWVATTGDRPPTLIWKVATDRAVPVRGLQGSEEFRELCWSPDGRRLAAAIGDASGSTDLSAKVWDVASGRILAECRGHTAPTWCIAFSPDGTRLVTGSMDKTAKVWEAASGRELLTLKGHFDDVHAAVFSKDGRRIVTSSDDQTVKVWETATAQEVANWQREEAETADYLAKLRHQKAGTAARVGASTTEESK